MEYVFICLTREGDITIILHDSLLSSMREHGLIVGTSYVVFVLNFLEQALL